MWLAAIVDVELGLSFSVRILGVQYENCATKDSHEREAWIIITVATVVKDLTFVMCAVKDSQLRVAWIPITEFTVVRKTLHL